MANLLMLYDNKDEAMGKYFEASYRDMSKRLEGLTFLNLHSLDTEKCLSNPVDHYIRVFESKPFMFVAYSHGSDDAIDIAGKQYIGNDNAYFFGDSLFYSCCCLTAKQLGMSLRNQGCKIFIGYDKIISSVTFETDSIFQECENSFISHFLTTDNATIQDSLGAMYKEYEQSSLFLTENYSTFTASTLESNLNAFIILCEPEDLQLTKQYFSMPSAFTGI
jgi:hypothetical protein